MCWSSHAHHKPVSSPSSPPQPHRPSEIPCVPAEAGTAHSTSTPFPPATTISAVPVITLCAASATAFRPEPHTMLIVIALTVSASPPRSAACRDGILPQTRRQHASHQALVDTLRRNPCAPHRLAHNNRAQFHRTHLAQRALKLPHRRSHGTHNHHIAHPLLLTSSPPKSLVSIDAQV